MQQLPAAIQKVFDNATCLYTKKQLEIALDKLATEITAELSDSHPVVLSVMLGGLITAGHLLPRLHFDLALDYVHATRYRGGIHAGQVQWKATPKLALQDRVVLIVDDILDGGVTLKAIVDYCLDQGAKKVLTAALLVKRRERKDVGLSDADFVGLTVPDCYLFGFGLDYKEHLRNLDSVYAIDL